jgi:hypothetical protein
MVIMMLGITARIPIADAIDGEPATSHPHSAVMAGHAGLAADPLRVLVPPNLLPPWGPQVTLRSLFRPPAPQTTRSLNPCRGAESSQLNALTHTALSRDFTARA